MTRTALALIVVAVSTMAAGAQAPAESENGRFVLKDTPDGLVKMDTRTGQMSICAGGGTLTCRVVPDERSALEAQITRLATENDTLRKQVQGGSKSTLNLPSDQELDQAMGFMEKVWRRMIDMIRTVEKEGKGI